MIYKSNIFYNSFIKRINSFHHSFSVISLLVLMMSYCSIAGYAKSNSSKIWVGTWSTAPQLVEPGNMPPAPGLNNNTLRQVVRVSIGGDSLRIRFSNEFSKHPVTMKSVRIAVSTGGNTIDAKSEKEIRFKGIAEVKMNPGEVIVSDPVSFKLKSRNDIAISIYFGETSPDVTGHPGSRTTSYLIAGDKTSNLNFIESLPTDHWYIINGIDVKAPKTASAVAILGNSITDGRGSGTNKQNRWTDILSESLLKNPKTRQVGVLNLGIGGNCVLKGGLGPTGISRFDRDILNQTGVRYAIVFIGVNDIGRVRSSEDANTTANQLISVFKSWIKKAHEKNIRIYGATITPFKGNSYYNQYSELCRKTVNAWIRSGDNYDEVIDFEKSIRSTSDSTKIVSSYQNDGLHPTEADYVIMGQSIDLKLFEK